MDGEVEDVGLEAEAEVEVPGGRDGEREGAFVLVDAEAEADMLCCWRCAPRSESILVAALWAQFVSAGTGVSTYVFEVVYRRLLFADLWFSYKMGSFDVGWAASLELVMRGRGFMKKYRGAFHRPSATAIT